MTQSGGNFLDDLLRGYKTVQSNGTVMPAEPTINFIGATVLDDPSNSRTNITVSANPNAVSGTGFWHSTSGTLDGAAKLVNLSTDTAGILPLTDLAQSGAATGDLMTWTGTQWAGSSTLAASINTGPAGTASPEQFLAVGNGVSDDTTPIQNALNALGAAGGGTLILGAKSYLVTGLTIPSSTTGIAIIGQGNDSVLKTVTDAPVIVAHQENFFAANFKILGNSTGASQDGIRSWAGLSGSSVWTAVNVECNSLGSYGFYIYYAGADIYQGPSLIGCRALSCVAGGFVAGSEFMTFTNCIGTGNGRGVEWDAGNVMWNGGDLSHNTVNFYAPSVGNDGHGAINGCTLNHATTHAVHIGNPSGLTNGLQINNCQIFYGDILLLTTHGVRFSNCHIDVTDYYFDGSQGTVFDGNTFLSANANTVHNNYNAHASTTHWMPNNIGTDGQMPAFIPVADDATSWASYFPGSGLTYFGGPVASTYSVALGPCVGNTTTFSALYMVPPGTAPSAANMSLLGDGNNLYFNLRSGSYKFHFQYAAATDVLIIDPTGDKVVMDLTALQWGTTFSAATIGTNKSGATLALQADAATTMQTLSSTGTEFAKAITLDQQTAPSAPAAGKFTIYMDSADGKLKAISSAGNITVLAV